MATFNNLTLNEPGDYELQVASDDLDTYYDLPITVNTATAATQLVVTTPPAPNPVTAASNFALTVSAEDGWRRRFHLHQQRGRDDHERPGRHNPRRHDNRARRRGRGELLPAQPQQGRYLHPRPRERHTHDHNGHDHRHRRSGNSTGRHRGAHTQPGYRRATFTAVVSAEDSDGNVDSNYTGPITLAIATGPSGGSLGGGGPINAVGGVVTFNQLVLPQTGTYTLQATSGSLTLATTDPITVNPAVAVPPTVTNLHASGSTPRPQCWSSPSARDSTRRRAENVANYTVTGALGTNYSVTSAVYNSADDTVTLSFGQRLNVHLIYTITVNGMSPNGLTSTTGVLLDGAGNGQPGSNYVQTFGRGILAGDAAEVSEARNMLTLEQINHGHITDRAIEELVAQGDPKVDRHHRHANH